MKELTKDIIFMVWGFLGSCTLGSLFILRDLHYLTGSTIKIINGVTNGFYLSILSLIFLSVIYFIWRKI